MGEPLGNELVPNERLDCVPFAGRGGRHAAGDYNPHTKHLSEVVMDGTWLMCARHGGWFLDDLSRGIAYRFADNKGMPAEVIMTRSEPTGNQTGRVVAAVAQTAG